MLVYVAFEVVAGIPEKNPAVRGLRGCRHLHQGRVLNWRRQVRPARGVKLAPRGTHLIRQQFCRGFTTTTEGWQTKVRVVRRVSTKCWESDNRLVELKELSQMWKIQPAKAWNPTLILKKNELKTD